MMVGGLTVITLAAHARNVPVAERTALEADLAALGIPLVLVRTCHRIDAFASPDGRTADAVTSALAGVAPEGTRLFIDESAIRHAVSVATGRDSVVLGEDQILHQVRLAVDEARGDGRLPATLERVFASALRAGRQARSWRTGPGRSLADLALDSVRDPSSQSLEGRTVLVVGAGAMGTLAAHAAARAGARVLVANRTATTAASVARAVGGRAVSVDPGTADAAPAIVVVALSAPWRIGSATAEHLVESGTRIVDLSVPPAVDPALAAALGDRYVDADRLAATGDGRSPNAAWARRVDRLIDETTREVLDWLARSSGRDVARALVERAERDRRAELDLLYRRRPGLDPADREAIEHMSRHLADRLLQAPLERLGRDADGDAGGAVRDLFAL